MIRDIDYGEAQKDRTWFDSFFNTDKFKKNLISGDLDEAILISVNSIKKTREKWKLRVK